MIKTTLKEYITKRMIRGKPRKAKVKAETVNGKRKESIELLNPKRPRAYTKHLTRKEAREIQKKRSFRAKSMDEKKTSKIDTTERWAKYPGKYDYPEVDTKGQGKHIGKGYAWKGQDNAKISKSRRPGKQKIAKAQNNTQKILKNTLCLLPGELKLIEMERTDREYLLSRAQAKLARLGSNPPSDKKAAKKYWNKKHYWENRITFIQSIQDKYAPFEINKPLHVTPGNRSVSEKSISVLDQIQIDEREWGGEIETLHGPFTNRQRETIPSIEKIQMHRDFPSSSPTNLTRDLNIISFHSHPQKEAKYIKNMPISFYFNELQREGKIKGEERDKALDFAANVFIEIPSDADIKNVKSSVIQSGRMTIAPNENTLSINADPKKTQTLKDSRHLWTQNLWALIKSGLTRARNTKQREKAMQKFEEQYFESEQNFQSQNGVVYKRFKKGESIQF